MSVASSRSSCYSLDNKPPVYDDRHHKTARNKIQQKHKLQNDKKLRTSQQRKTKHKIKGRLELQERLDCATTMLDERANANKQAHGATHVSMTPCAPTPGKQNKSRTEEKADSQQRAILGLGGWGLRACGALKTRKDLQKNGPGKSELERRMQEMYL